MTALRKPHDILKDLLHRKQEQQPAYSIRALARDIGVTPSYLAAVFAGKKKIPLKRLSALAAKLDIDDLAIIKLKQALVLHDLSEDDQKNFLLLQSSEGQQRAEFLNAFSEESRAHLHLWSNWYNIAIMDMSTCTDFKADVVWIAKKLGISQQEAAASLHFLISKGYIVEVEGRLIKANKLLRMPARESMGTIRHFHKQLMQKAVEVMNSQTSKEDFDKRLISGVMIAANPEKIQEAKNRLNLALHEVALILSEGECTEVYQLGVQLFALTKK